ncbi:HECT E3 ubiquitin ligase [Achlya hypogyna]|uniref:HECT-type E3 ubiquitin transferase n=1 Tax=Achlya hypogyna TaxID=1202772 RepID=A0A1V9YWF8_ACHHY|nr:HECT E3 ubiquitin ligase [Achlya hypogyna]
MRRDRRVWQRDINVYGQPYWRRTPPASGKAFVVTTINGSEFNLVEAAADATTGYGLGGRALPGWWLPQLKALSDASFGLKYAWLLAQIPATFTGYAKVKVYRDEIFLESLSLLLQMESGKHLCGFTHVTLLGESGVDAGGIQREWYTELTVAIFDETRGLFSRANKDSYVINPNSAIAYGEEHLLCFQAVGRLLGRAIVDGQVLPCNLSVPLFKAILGTPLSMEDVRHIDEATYNSLVYLQDGDVTDLALDFSATLPSSLAVVDLVPDGRHIPVTNANKRAYVDCMVRYLLFDRVAPQLTSLLKGIYEVLPQELLMPFDYKELELVLCGVSEVDVADWKASTSVSTTLKRSEALTWFWDVVERDMSADDRSKLLQFTTGSSRVPVQGFKGLTSYDGTLCPFSLQAVPYTLGAFPKVHSCFNRLDLPLYPTRALLKEALFALIEIETMAFTMV